MNLEKLKEKIEELEKRREETAQLHLKLLGAIEVLGALAKEELEAKED